MAAPYLTHDIVCIGAHEPDQHDFHAANARAVGDLMTGGLGPSRIVADVHAGSGVRLNAVERAFESAATRAAKNHVVYFSGRAGPLGFEVADGAIGPEMLARHVAQVRADAVLLVLDLAIGAEPDSALAPSWLRELVASRPGMRVAIARATRIGTGVVGEGLARFTSALIGALESAPGDLRFDEDRFISDKLAMEHVRGVLAERWGMTNFPVELGSLGNMPLARSQASGSVGSAVIVDVVPGAGLSSSVKWVIEKRANIRTNLDCSIEHEDGTVITQDSIAIVPNNPIQKGKTRVRFQRSVLGRGAAALRTTDLHWRIALRDGRGRTLAERVVELP